MGFIVFIVLVALAWIAISIHLTKKRREALLIKYGDEHIVNMIMERSVWQGQSPTQLTDSLGSPIDVDRKVMKTKTREVWKYNQTGKGRYALRVTIEDGVVVGWDKKS